MSANLPTDGNNNCWDLRRKLDADPELKGRLFDQVCERICDGRTLSSVCLDPDMPSRYSIQLWMRHDPELRDRYRLAKQVASEHDVDSLDDILANTPVDSASINLARLKIDTIKWKASKFNRRLFGDRLELAGDPDAPIRTETNHVIDLTSLTDEHLRQLASIAGALGGAAKPGGDPGGAGAA